METANLQAIFGADTSDFEAGINRVSRLGKDLGDQMKAFGKSVGATFSNTSKITSFGTSIEGVTQKEKDLDEQNKASEESIEQFADAASKAFAATAVDIGKALGSGTQLNPLLDLIHQLGKALEQYAAILISTGTAMLVAGDPAGTLKLGEGIALEAIGAGAEAVKMASGGLVSGSAFVNVGEYAGAVHNPEVIAPLDKLKGMLGGQNPGGNFTFRIQGDELVAILDRVDTNNSYTLGGQ